MSTQAHQRNIPTPIAFTQLAPRDCEQFVKKVSAMAQGFSDEEILDQLQTPFTMLERDPLLASQIAAILIVASERDDPKVVALAIETMKKLDKRARSNPFQPDFYKAFQSHANSNSAQVRNQAVAALHSTFFRALPSQLPAIVKAMRDAFAASDKDELENIGDHLQEILGDYRFKHIEISSETASELVGFALDTLGSSNVFLRRKTASNLGRLARTSPDDLDTLLVVAQNIMKDNSPEGLEVQDFFVQSLGKLGIVIMEQSEAYPLEDTELRTEVLLEMLEKLSWHDSSFARKKVAQQIGELYDRIPGNETEFESILKRLAKDPDSNVSNAANGTLTWINHIKQNPELEIATSGRDF